MVERNALDFSNTEIAFSGKSDKELRKMAWLFRMMSNEFLVRLSSSLGLFAVKANVPFSRRIIRETIFEQFCGGENLLQCQPIIDRLYKQNCLTVLDFGAEAKESEDDFNRTMSENMRSIDFAASNESVPVVSSKLSGYARFELLVKVQEGKTLSASEQSEYRAIVRRLDNVCSRAAERKSGIMIDAEETWIQDVIDDLVIDMMATYNKSRVVVYNTYQLYLKDALQRLKRDYEKAVSEGYLLGVKLVRGAYMEKERKRAKLHGYPSPIHDNKDDVDRDYNDAIRFCVDNYERIACVNSTHNAASCRLMAELIEEREMIRNHPHLHFSQLYGMGDHLTFNLAHAGFNVSKYLPYGQIKDIIPYLIRRAQENTAVRGSMSREYSLIHKEMERRNLV